MRLAFRGIKGYNVCMDRIRVASLQYLIRPVKSYDEFAEQVEGLVETAADYKCRLVVFPEYFTIQLLTLANVKRPISQQVRDLATQRDRFVEMMSGLAKKRGIYIVGGTIPVFSEDKEQVRNECYVFAPNGKVGMQGKLHMTRFEKEEWFVSAHNDLKVFETDFGLMGVNICYDVEFPELSRALALKGISVLVTPSCTDDRQGFLRVRYCAQARAIENQLYVIHSGTVGSLPMVPAISLNYGQASILTPSDFPFSRDGVLAEGIPNQETMVIGELNLKTIEESRTHGTVLPLLDSARTKDLIKHITVENL
jgi:predicted amidohydrolase